MSKKTDYIQLLFKSEHFPCSDTITCFDNSVSLLEWSSGEIFKVAGSLGCLGEATGAGTGGHASIGNEDLTNFLSLLEGKLTGLAKVLEEAALDDSMQRSIKS